MLLKQKALIITADEVTKAYSSLPATFRGVKTITSMGLNVMDLLHYDRVFVTKEAVTRIEEVLA